MIYISYGRVGQVLTLIESDAQGILSYKQQYDSYKQLKAVAVSRGREYAANGYEQVEVGPLGGGMTNYLVVDGEEQRNLDSVKRSKALRERMEATA